MRSIADFKGVRDGLILKVAENQKFDIIKESLLKKAEESNKLIVDSNLIGTIGSKFTYEEKSILEKILIDYFKLNVISLEPYYEKTIREKNVSNDTKFIEDTLRSGTEIISDGNIVVLGDVNPGAILKARGNIIVMGKLRGIAHAGITGDNNAFISANLLAPNQIRIGNIISRAPDSVETLDEFYPEKAYISGERIVVEKL